MFNYFETYTRTIISGIIIASGIRKSPSQKTGDVKSMTSIPRMTEPKPKVGQN